MWGMRKTSALLFVALFACGSDSDCPDNVDMNADASGIFGSTTQDAGGLPLNADAGSTSSSDGSVSFGWDGSMSSSGDGGVPWTLADAATGSDAGAGTDAGGNPGGQAGDLPGWKLVWQDEFDGAQGTVPDPSRWVMETGGDGWGNNQQEFDTDRPENASHDGQGFLVLTARKEQYSGKEYTAARLKTQGKFSHTYGRYEARMKLPRGQGMWPAFWMLGNDIGSAGWPSCGEIDIMEHVGKEPNNVYGTLHGPGYSGANGVGASYSAGVFADDVHIFALEWEASEVRWYVDGQL